ncbi:hypothetical protein DSO57_1007821, partial [Entomophthora muscae]
TPTAAETTYNQLFGVLYITLTGMVYSMVPKSGPWSLLRQSMSYIIKLAPILWWALPAGSAPPHPKPPNASIYAWLPENGGDLDTIKFTFWSPTLSNATMLVVNQ